LINHLGINNNEIRENIANEVSNGDEFNIEARVASKYFPILFGKSFIRKNEDTEFNKYVNSFLNYGYTILLSIVCRSIVKNGYDTRIGIFHKSFSNHTALGSDLMEPFRVIVDCAVYNLIRKLKQLDFFLSSDVKRKLIELFNKQIIYNKERINITLCIDKYVQDILDNDLKIEIEYLFDEY
jgi:CRISPR-associated protein Cas1